MGIESGTENDCSFDLAGIAGPVRVSIGGGVVRIVSGKKDQSIPEESLLRIEHIPGSWRSGSSGPGLLIQFLYRAGERQRKAQIALATDDPRTRDFLQWLKDSFPKQACFGPNQGEKDRILSLNRKSAYSLHALHILTPVGIVMGLLMVSVLNVSFVIAEDMAVRAVSLQALSQVRELLLVLCLVPAAFMALILGRMRMVLRTDREGLTIRRMIGGKKYSWRDVEIGEPRSDAFNVYTGLFCYYSDSVNVVSSRSLVEIPLLLREKKKTTLRLNLEEAAPLFRELYYRGKVTLETAKKYGAFL
jgi:hypothetical protein